MRIQESTNNKGRMIFRIPQCFLALAALLTSSNVYGFQRVQTTTNKVVPVGGGSRNSNTALAMERRDFGRAVVGGIVTSGLLNRSEQAEAEVFLDPAMYGDQELRVSAVDSIKEQVRRAILAKPILAPAFYQLSLLDGLSYDDKTKKFGPDGSVVANVLKSKNDDENTKTLQEACKVLIDGAKSLKRKTAITVSDSVAIGGSEAIESVGGPVLAVQLGRTEPPSGSPLPPLPIDLFSGKYSGAEVAKAFRNAGLTEREMTALLGGLMTLQLVEKSRTAEDWRASAKPKFRERGKIGRASEFKPLSDEDIASELAEDEDDEPSLFDDSNLYIAESFGTREERFGKRIGVEEINEKTFNRYLKELDEAASSKKKGDLSKFGWIGTLLVDKDSPTTQTWVKKYAGSNLNYLKDLKSSYNAVTQLGAVFTGGKYESLLKDKPRKALNDDGLNLF